MATAMAATAAHATGRQRGDGSEPSGTSRNSSGTSPTAGTQTKLASHAASTPPGIDPGLVRSAYSPYWPRNTETPEVSPIVQRIQPIGLAGR
jgi:hypothetical protein